MKFGLASLPFLTTPARSSEPKREESSQRAHHHAGMVHIRTSERENVPATPTNHRARRTRVCDCVQVCFSFSLAFPDCISNRGGTAANVPEGNPEERKSVRQPGRNPGADVRVEPREFSGCHEVAKFLCRLVEAPAASDSKDQPDVPLVFLITCESDMIHFSK